MALQVCEKHVDACGCVFVHVYGTDVLRTRVYVEVRAVFRHQFFLCWSAAFGRVSRPSTFHLDDSPMGNQ